MAKTYRDRATRPWSRSRTDEFRCRHCRAYVGALPSGGHHRNHCPFCLYSRHVDDRRPGDRASHCGASMAPVGGYARPNGESVIVHRCWDCDQERDCRVAADDDFALVMRLAPMPSFRERGRRLDRVERTA